MTQSVSLPGVVVSNALVAEATPSVFLGSKVIVSILP
jgi:hypothetical protein